MVRYGPISYSLTTAPFAFAAVFFSVSRKISPHPGAPVVFLCLCSIVAPLFGIFPGLLASSDTR